MEQINWRAKQTMSVLKLNLCTLKSAHLKSLNVQMPYKLRLPIRRCSSLRAVRSHHNPSSFTPPPSELESSISSNYTASVGSSFLPQLNFTRRHIVVLNVIACSVALSATWLFVSAIPTLLAFKRAAESLEKLMDATREELPDTMAAIRLSGMEISDLTMELSDLGQEITQGVKSSTRAIRVAEERLRGLANMTQPSPTEGTPAENQGRRTGGSEDR